MALGFRGFLHTARGGGEERKGGMGVTWRKHDKHVVRRHAISYPVEMHLSLSSFFSSLRSRSFVRAQRERKNSLSYGVSMLLNQFERIFIIPWKYVFRFHSKFPPLLFLGIP